MKRNRVTSARIAELTRWVKKNKNASWHDFVKETGGTQSQYYHVRDALGLSKKNPHLSEAMKKVAKRRKSKQATITLSPDANATVEIKVEDRPKDEVIIEGNTPDFIWYEMDLMQRKLGDISSRLAHVMKVAQARDNDQKKMMRDLIQENTQLRVNNNSLTQQVSELTEMINGSPV